MRPLFRVAVSVLAVSAQPPNVRDLFPGKPVCHLPFKEQRVGRTLFQIVGETRTGKELFRIRIGGLHEKDWLTWWSYGVKNCGGFNRDGVLDYSWSGGGGTSHGHYLILSTPTAHRIIGIEKTFEREWTRGGRGKAPNLGLLAEAFFERVTVRWTPDKLVMIAEGERYDDKLRKSTKISMEAEDRNWVIIR